MSGTDHKGKKSQAKAGSGFTPAAKLNSTKPTSSYLDRNAFLIASTLLIFITLFIFKDFIFFKKLFLYKDIGSDTINGFYPFLKHYADYLHTTGIPKWSFNAGMGQNLFPFCLTQGPFSAFLYLLGPENVAYALGYVEVVKVLSGGLLFFLYLRTLSLHPFACIVGSLLFAFSGFMILGGQYFIFSYEAVLLALLLFSFEKLFKQNSWVLFPIAIALIGSAISFNLYVYGLFLAIYAIFRFIYEKKWDTKAFALLFSKMILLGLLGIAISSVFLFSNVLQILESPRGNGNVSYFQTLSGNPVFAFGDAMHNITALLRFFSNDLLGTGSNFRGWNQHYLEAPMFYCGLLSLLLFTSVFQFLDKKRKLIYLIFLGFWILPVIFPYFRYAFWLFTGDYYRAFSFFVVFTILYGCLQALNHLNNKIKFKQLALIITFLVLQVILSINYSSYFVSGNKIMNPELLTLIRILLLIYAGLIYLLARNENKFYAQVSLLTVLCLELGYFAYISVNNRSILTVAEYKNKSGYNDYSTDAVAYLKSMDKSFYRIDKDYNSGPSGDPSLNDAMVQNYFGTTSYNSFNQEHYVSFLQAIGNADKGLEWQSRWTRGLGGRLTDESIGNVKYFMTKNNFSPFSYDSIGQFGDVKLIRNRFYLPLGFCYDKFISQDDYDKMSITQRDYMIMKSFFIKPDQFSEYTGFEKLSLKDTIQAYTWDMYSNDRDSLRADTLAISDWGQNFIHGKINLEKRKLLFFSIPFDLGWAATVDGKSQSMKMVDAGMSGLLLEKGIHTVELDYSPRLLKSGLIVSLISLLVYGILFWWERNKKIKTGINQPDIK